MRIVFMGTPDFATTTLDALVAAGHEIACAYTRAPRPAGRGQALRPSPVHARALALGLPVRHPATLRDAAEQAAFAALGADVAVVVAYGLLLPQPVLDAPRLGCLNIHASLLPRWRGAAPIQRAIMAGDATTGISIMRMEAGLDTGPVLLTRETPIGAAETAGELHDRLATLGAAAITEALDRLPTLVAVPQDDARATHAARIDKAEARIDWSRPAPELARRIRGLSPFPGAWCLAGNERLKLLCATPVPGTGTPGSVLAAAPGAFTVACGEGAVAITRIQREGRRPMPADEALRGLARPSRLD
ncbi:MAG: methionyl-tRNA formyltransferase [Rubellimicrobium sp.]|nr:methionyl-tRNA formyltransferase [Rubellimicrobium sp.]